MNRPGKPVGPHYLSHQTLDTDHRIILDVTFFVRPQARPTYSQVTLQPDAFRYDKEQDIYICPNEKALRLTFLLRGPSGLSLQYHPDKQDCLACPLREQCMTGRQHVRKVEHSYFRPSVEKNFARQNNPEYADALRKRQIWCEGTFAAQKRGHNLKCLLRRGLEAAEDHCLLSATAMNLKRMIQAAS